MVGSKNEKLKNSRAIQDGKDLIINAAISIENLSTAVDYGDSINAQSTISLLKTVELKHPDAEVIYTICDNARYYRSKKVKEYLGKSKIALEFLPPYSLNLNLIEALKYFRKIVIYNEYYGTFDEFRKACKSFLDGLKDTRKI